MQARLRCPAWLLRPVQLRHVLGLLLKERGGPLQGHQWQWLPLQGLQGPLLLLLQGLQGHAGPEQMLPAEAQLRGPPAG